MLILTIRSDRQQAELGLYEADKQLAAITWLAHRELAETIHQKLLELVTSAGKRLNNLQGIVLYKGPGSFTGLRIGAAVANALAASLQLAIVGESGEHWQQQGCQRLIAGQTESIVVPNYGTEPHITAQKH